MKRIRQKRVLLAFPTTRVSRVDKMRGVLQFASEAGSWSIDILQGELTSEALADADGVIATGQLPARSRHVLERATIPTCYIEMDSPRTTNVAHVHSDPASFAAAIVEYFLRAGIYNGFSVLMRPTPLSFHASCASFIRTRLEKANLPLSVFTSARNLDFSRLPLAIFANDDDLAAQAILHSLAKGLRVPQDVAVLGFANDVVLCENNATRISSIELDFERQGYLAARELDRLMSGSRPGPPRDIPVDLKRIIERDSTTLPKTGEGLVRDALAFIKANATQPIRVTDVVKKLRVSRRLAELRFRERTNGTILESILRHRLEATKHELLNSTDSIAKVCERTGWRSENAPKKLFVRRFGVSMREFRNSQKQVPFSGLNEAGTDGSRHSSTQTTRRPLPPPS